MKAMANENIMFRSQIYVDEDHNIQNNFEHLFRTIEQFLAEQFKLD